MKLAFEAFGNFLGGNPVQIDIPATVVEKVTKRLEILKKVYVSRELDLF